MNRIMLTDMKWNLLAMGLCWGKENVREEWKRWREEEKEMTPSCVTILAAAASTLNSFCLFAHSFRFSSLQQQQLVEENSFLFFSFFFFDLFSIWKFGESSKAHKKGYLFYEIIIYNCFRIYVSICDSRYGSMTWEWR